MSASSSGKISLALGASRKQSKPAPTNGVKRSHAALQDHEDVDNEHGKAQTVSHFDQSAGGAIDENGVVQDRGPLVIKPQTNRDWKEASQRNKRQRSHKLPEPQNGHTEDLEVREAEKPTYGLNVFKRSQGDNVAHTNGNAALQEVEQDQEIPPEPNGDAPIRQMTEEEEAMDALLGRSTKQGLVLPAMTEEEAFERDYKDAPDMATLDDYARVPVDQFGAAMLRGMGWKDGEGIGANRGKKVEKTKIPERRPALLGIGAKEEAAVAQEMGTWGKAAKDRRGPEVIYNPVLLRDKRTGEMFTEEELEKKKARDEREKYELEYEREEKRKERERRRNRDGSREREPERREKGSKRDLRDDRDRRKYDDSDEEYYRRKEKERRRREREREDSDHDRERSKRHDSDREKRRNHHHDRDRRR